MLDFLIEFDQQFFLLLNSAHNSLFDNVMVAMSNRFVWIPLYAYLLFVIIKRYKLNSLYIVLMTVVLITLCDQASVHLFKNVFLRLRPCHEPALDGLVHIVNNHCGGQYGFVSSHAANVFGLAVFLGKMLKPASRHWMTFLIIWAIVVSYSRIYLGVHYPFDILGGALLGILLARLIFFVLSIIDKRYSLKMF